MSTEQSILDKAVEKFIYHRNQCTILNKKWEEEVNVHKHEMEKLRIALLRKLDQIGAKSLRTDHGTIVASIKQTPTCGDWDAFYNWVKENDRLDLMQKRLATKQFSEDIEAWAEEAKKKLGPGEEFNVADVLPPGITVIVDREISIRKA